MTKLNETQRILLSSASQRGSGSVLPIKASLKRVSGGVTIAIAGLVALGLAEERQTDDAKALHRTDGDVRFGAFNSDAGLRLIDAGPDDEEKPEPPVAPPARASKSAAVIALLQRPDGATMPELIEATGWLPHTTRAALTGLRHKGHVIERSKREDMRATASLALELMSGVDAQLAALTTMSSAQLRERRAVLTTSPVPRVSPAMLRLAPPWEIQARAFGGLSHETVRQLDQLARL